MSTGRILVVEDETGLRDALATYLEAFGHRVEVFAEAERAITAGGRFRPDVVICDWRLEGSIDGVEVARALTRDRTGTVVIFITGYSTGELRRQAAGLPVHSVLAKPVSLMQVGEEVEQALAG